MTKTVEEVLTQMRDCAEARLQVSTGSPETQDERWEEEKKHGAALAALTTELTTNLATPLRQYVEEQLAETYTKTGDILLFRVSWSRDTKFLMRDEDLTGDLGIRVVFSLENGAEGKMLLGLTELVAIHVGYKGWDKIRGQMIEAACFNREVAVGDKIVLLRNGSERRARTESEAFVTLSNACVFLDDQACYVSIFRENNVRWERIGR